MIAFVNDIHRLDRKHYHDARARVFFGRRDAQPQRARAVYQILQQLVYGVMMHTRSFGHFVTHVAAYAAEEIRGGRVGGVSRFVRKDAAKIVVIKREPVDFVVLALAPVMFF